MPGLRDSVGSFKSKAKGFSATLEAYKTILNVGAVGAFAVLFFLMLSREFERKADLETRMIDSMLETDQKLTATMDALKAGADRSREERRETASEVKMIATGLKANDESNRRREETLTNMLMEMRGLRNDQRVRLPKTPGKPNG